MAISPHGPVGFLVPTSINCDSTVNARRTRALYPSARRLHAVGGVARAALRWASTRSRSSRSPTPPTSRATSARLQFKYPHLSVGPGVRYESPVGPIRLDFGIRVPGAQALGQDELPTDPASTGKSDPVFFATYPAPSSSRSETPFDGGAGPKRSAARRLLSGLVEHPVGDRA